jgi:NADP-dependent 3-hydroxy acid dehydrogenase YdfG
MTTSDRPLAWITGGATGIGLESARRLARAGYRVAISGRRDSELAKAIETLAAEGADDAIAAPLDVSDADAVGRVAASLATSNRIEVLVCSAGINVPNRRWKDLDAAGFARVCRINLEGVASCIAAVLPGMRERSGGTVVVIGSWAGWRFTHFTGAAYGATKTGLTSIVESLNYEEGRHGVRASLVCPGEVATPILRSRPVPPSEEEIARMLLPEDVAAAVHYAVTAPTRVCINEIVVSPSWNRMYIGGEDLKPRD